MAIKRGDLKSPALPFEEVQVDGLGGAVIVRGLSLSQRLELAVKGTDFKSITGMLSTCVVDDDAMPLFTEQEWDAFGSCNFDETMKLWDVACRLSGLLKGESAKN